MKSKSPQKTSLPFRTVLAAVMKERDLTVAQIASLAGVSRSVASDWLSGAAPRDLAAVGRLARSLGLSLRALILAEEEDPQSPAENLPSVSMTPEDLFQEIDLFDGHVRVIIRKLVPNGREKKRG